jgi:EmrB/QacA subfamily drug resistance transporter
LPVRHATDPTAGETGPAELKGWRRWFVVLAVQLGVFLAALDGTIIGTAMPTVIASLGGLALYSWVFAIYMLASTTSLPIFGRLSDVLGRRHLFLIAIAIFVVGAAGSGSAGTMPHLIVSRGIQGLGAGGIFGLSQAVFGEIFPPGERGRMQAFLTTVWAVASLLGPVTGGLLVDHLGWRWVFLLSLPIGSLAFSMILRYLSGVLGGGSRRPIDYPGAAILVAGVLGMLLGLFEAGARGRWTDPAVLGLLGLAGCAAVTFIWRERRAPAPILPLPLFLRPTFRASVAGSFLAGMAMFGAFSFLPLFVQIVLGGSALQAGLVLTPASLGWCVGNAASGRAVNRIGYRWTMLMGTACMAAAYLFLVRMSPATTLTGLSLAGLVLGIGMGANSMSAVLGAQHLVPRSELGIAVTTPFFFRNLGGTTGVALMGTILTARVGPLARGLRQAPAAAGGLGADPALQVAIAGGLAAAFAVGLSASLLNVALSFAMPDTSPTQPEATAGR